MSKMISLTVFATGLVVLLFSAVHGMPDDHSVVSDEELHSMLDSSDLTDPSVSNRLFRLWKKKHNKNYESKQDEDEALQTLLLNAKKVKVNREDSKSGKTTHQLALNKFADMTFDEFKRTKLGLIKPRQIVKREATSEGRQKRQALPQSIDWKAKGAVTPIKMQANCGCCWTFATSGAIEGQYFKKSGQLVSFSEQELVECVTEYAGCNGGDVSVAFDFIAKNKGLATEANYPYVSQDGVSYSSCKTSTIPQVKMNVTYTILQGDAELKQALATVGPIAAALSVADEFMLYTQGVMDPVVNCGIPFEINHAILVVGYGVDQKTGQSYWLIKNSWDTDWGENGYLRLLRSVPNSCGIGEYPIKMTLQ